MLLEQAEKRRQLQEREYMVKVLYKGSEIGEFKVKARNPEDAKVKVKNMIVNNSRLDLAVHLEMNNGTRLIDTNSTNVWLSNLYSEKQLRQVVDTEKIKRDLVENGLEYVVIELRKER